MNLNKTITDIHGKPGKKSFPRNEADANNIETTRNVLLNALSVYPVRDRKEVFVVNNLASKILNTEEEWFVSGEDAKFLVEVLHESTFRKEGETTKGVYLAHVVAQVLQDLLATNNN